LCRLEFHRIPPPPPPPSNNINMKATINPLCLLAAAIAAHIANGEECITPPKFTGASPKSTIYVIKLGLAGDFFAQLMDGMKQQAALVGDSGVNMKILFSDGNETKQAEDILLAAQDETTVGILTTDIGNTDTVCEAINTVFNTTDIAVVSLDFEGEACSKKQVLASQQNADIARLVLDNAVAVEGQGVNVGYVSDLNYRPLRIRNDVWEAYKAEFNWNQVFFVENATGFATQADLQSAIEDAIKGSENVTFIYSPWDYLSVTTVSAVKETVDTIDVYGADVNNQDITLMRNSTWKATAGGNPMYMGASLTRMVAKSAAKELMEKELIIPSTLITQAFLLENNVTNLNNLDDKLPAMRLLDFVTSCWIESLNEGPIVPPPTPATEAPSSGNMASWLAVPICLAFAVLHNVMLG
jgi:simple sugar transport system substrate-binding protein